MVYSVVIFMPPIYKEAGLLHEAQAAGQKRMRKWGEAILRPGGGLTREGEQADESRCGYCATS